MTKEEFKNYLEKRANKECKFDNQDWFDKSSIYDMCGGNSDDAYDMGVSDGMTLAAREILDHWNSIVEQ